ncbi:hypothetical protein GOV13_04475 [Candidatus Pacearchaeota archaeon]|nr:hypothetical protein [Candidatus Pacearchaeota archaeon]
MNVKASFEKITGAKLEEVRGIPLEEFKEIVGYNDTGMGVRVLHEDNNILVTGHLVNNRKYVTDIQLSGSEIYAVEESEKRIPLGDKARELANERELVFDEEGCQDYNSFRVQGEINGADKLKDGIERITVAQNKLQEFFH